METIQARMIEQAALQKQREADLDPWRMQAHLMPAAGWLNDPNGLCQLDGIHHIFFQYSPMDSEGGIKMWGHYTTKDWFHYTRYPSAVLPDSIWDRDGAYSGSALVERGKMYLYYTGNVCFEGDGITTGLQQNVIMIQSEDGFHFSDKQCLMKNSDYPASMSLHVRDPKVFEQNGHYWMVLGARDKESCGCALLYRSEDKVHWTLHQQIRTQTPFGYMWECPDLFCIQGQWILLCCPQGVKQDGWRYANVYQSGYFLLNGSLEAGFTIDKPFCQLDYGHDFYAPQTYTDDQGRRILIGWMGMWDANYTNLTVQYGWQHALTLPRLLTFEQNRIHQKILPQFIDLAQAKQANDLAFFVGEEAWAYSLDVRFEENKDWHISLSGKTKLRYDEKSGMLCLMIQEDEGAGRGLRQARVKQITDLQLIVDHSCLELLLNDGQTCLTSRFYPQKAQAVCFQGTARGTIRWCRLRKIEVKDHE